MNTAPFHIAYGTAKAAVVAMTRTMAVELALDGIRVNAVAPGVTETAASATYVDEDPERDRTAIAMGRRGTPEEQAGAILFLLSDLSSYVTGQTLLVDGGLNLQVDAPRRRQHVAVPERRVLPQKPSVGPERKMK